MSDSKNVKSDEKHQKLVQDQPLGLYPSPSPCPPTLHHGLWRQKFIRHTCRNHFHLDQSAGFWASKNCSGYPNFKSSLVHIQNYGMETFFWMHTSARSSRRSSWWRGGISAFWILLVQLPFCLTKEPVHHTKRLPRRRRRRRTAQIKIQIRSSSSSSSNQIQKNLAKKALPRGLQGEWFLGKIPTTGGCLATKVIRKRVWSKLNRCQNWF